MMTAETKLLHSYRGPLRPRTIGAMKLHSQLSCLAVACLAAVLLPMTLTADEASDAPALEPAAVLDLWPDGVPGAIDDAPPVEIYPGGIQGVNVPKIYAYPVKGAEAAPAFVVLPGGGYAHLAIEKEGHAVARWLNGLGIAAFVLEYRHNPYRAPIPLMDAQQAMRRVRHDAASWHIDPHRVGIVGFSAGGHLAASVLTSCEHPVKMDDPLADVSCRPDFAVLGYPVISMSDEDLVHAGSRDNLLGANSGEPVREQYSPELHVPDDPPPVFLFAARDDSAVPYENSLVFQQAVRAKGGSAEVCLVDEGGHGFGLRIPEVMAAWKAWLQKQGL
jgi:acetyl esterase/lipase